MRKISTTLLFVLTAELAIGGGGRLTAWGPVSLRMILFGAAIMISCFYFIEGRKLPTSYKGLLLFFSIVTAISLVIGIYSGAPRNYWWEDVKPLLYFLILPFFHFTVEDLSATDRIAGLYRVTSIIQALLFFLVLVLIHTGIIPFLHFYNLVIGSEEFFFRGELTFTYKGFLFLCIGTLFIGFTGGKHKAVWMCVLIFAILLTVTRGFWLALLATYGVYSFSHSKLKLAFFGTLAVIILLFGQSAITKTSELISQLYSQPLVVSPRGPKALLGDRALSDGERLQQVREVGSQITLCSLWAGHGFGNGTESRPVHMEISYVEIFHKQGLLGLAFWFYLFWLLFHKYKIAKPDPYPDAFFFGSVFIFIQSFTNQYINNPIGLSFVLLSLVCLDRYSSVAPTQPAEAKR